MNEDFIAQRLSKLREQKGFTARDMSLSIGRSESYINKIENKRTKPSLMELFVICEHLDISVKDFFDESSRYPEQLNAIIENMKKLDEESLTLIDSLIRRIIGT